ncbi:phosphosulfolactate synthase [Alicyclobacillus hesperidum subsp. aegles]|uniref:phosphosulfolactate synthase n=1 Tax=Alicyclobacillus hesperidum TaxID=89784 RepID=UPI0022291A8B|nr:phosphosulfolactate synthase [Alicyclobacillus hesperidum]GLG01090.1 phosphosulfolactate synthase [Alicyclobacillus hesperidum subsp. aegles]
MIVSDGGAFSQIISAPLGLRAEKPRSTGLTMVIDKGLGFSTLTDILEVGAAYVDLFKFGFGTSPLYPEPILRRKLALLSEVEVLACPGGTLGEIAWLQGTYTEYLQRCQSIGFTAMEVSDGTIELPASDRQKAIAQAKDIFPVVVSEIGKKLSHSMDIVNCARSVVADLNAGSDYVIIEGRESGEGVGVYDANGKVLDNLVQTFIDELPAWARKKVIWEAPKKQQQVEFIRRFGSDVNLGNIPAGDLLALECLRLGLRADTLVLAMQASHPHRNPTAQ